MGIPISYVRPPQKVNPEECKLAHRGSHWLEELHCSQ